MNKTLLALAVLAATSLPVFAVDGQVLINQSTVIASGGFPYHITQPGSYKLTGNIIAPVDLTGILVSASHVTIDLNGFNIQCSADGNINNIFFSCLGDGGMSGAHDISVRNGTITATASASSISAFNQILGVSFSSTLRTTIEDLHVDVTIFNFGGSSIAMGPNSIVRHNILSGNGGTLSQYCPSLLEGNVQVPGGGAALGSGCLYINNIGVVVF